MGRPRQRGYGDDGPLKDRRGLFWPSETHRGTGFPSAFNCSLIFARTSGDRA